MKKVMIVRNDHKANFVMSMLAGILGHKPHLLNLLPDIHMPVLKFEKPKAIITAVIKKTPGGRHAWCESNVGVIRKPLTSIPNHLL